MMDRTKKGQQETATFFHPDLLEMPEEGPPFLKGHRCKRCGKIWFPKFAPCPDPDCWSDAMDVILLSRRGKIGYQVEGAKTVLSQVTGGGVHGVQHAVCT